MKAFVLDVSACIPWCCEDEITKASEDMLDWAAEGSELHVPALWIWEITNAVGVALKRQRITTERAKEFLDQLAALNFKIDPVPEIADLPRLHDLAVRHRLTSYDTAYLDLAARRSLPLATLDADLEKAALSEGIVILGK